MNDTVECPYCGEECDLTDWYANGESPYEDTLWDCPTCGEEFIINAEVEYSFYPRKKEEQP